MSPYRVGGEGYIVKQSFSHVDKCFATVANSGNREISCVDDRSRLSVSALDYVKRSALNGRSAEEVCSEVKQLYGLVVVEALVHNIRSQVRSDLKIRDPVLLMDTLASKAAAGSVFYEKDCRYHVSQAHLDIPSATTAIIATVLFR